MKYILFLFCLFMFVPKSFAQISSDAFEGFKDKSQPIEIDGNKLEISDTEKKLTYEGEVKIVRGDSVIKTEKLIIHYNQQGQPQDIQQLEFIGNVNASRQTSAISADRGLYDVGQEIVTLQGNVIAKQASNNAQGCKLIVDIISGVAELKSCGERVNATITPDEIEENNANQ